MQWDMQFEIPGLSYDWYILYFYFSWFSLYFQVNSGICSKLDHCNFLAVLPNLFLRQVFRSYIYIFDSITLPTAQNVEYGQYSEE
jgi:hypothetical protein